MSNLWQNPYVNLFKHYGVGQWKKCNKEGDVSSLMDRLIKCPIYKISGVVPANNYIVIPKHNSQSVGLVGSYFYVLFHPIVGQFFAIHLEVVSTCGVIIRISISNLYKQFKASATWLQFPFVLEHNTKDFPIKKWTVLMFNFPSVLKKYLNRNFSHVKSIKMCANVMVKNIFSSSKVYNPYILDKKIRKIEDITDPADEPFPRDMRYPVAKGHEWREFYNFIRFPSTSENISVSIKGSNQQNYIISPSFVPSKSEERTFNVLPIVRHNASGVQHIESKRTATKVVNKKPSEKLEEDFQNMSLIENVNISSSKYEHKPTKPDRTALCRLEKIIGFGPCDQVVFCNDANSFYYAAGAVLILQSIDTSLQITFEGHNNVILTFAVNDAEEFIASSQKESPLVRIWNVLSRRCVAIIKSADTPCTVLHFSTIDNVLLGVTKIRPKSKLLLWDTALLKLDGDINIISEGVSNEVIIAAELSPLTSSRFVSCSTRKVQIWRLRANKIKSCNISIFNGLEYVLNGVKWGSKSGNNELSIYVSTASGVIIVIDSSQATVSKIIDISQVDGRNLKSINSLAVHGAFFVTGSDDGNMKVWDSSFKNVILNAEHESSVVHVSVSTDGLKLLAVTETDSVGVLDATTRVYKTVVRSHSKKINGVAINPCHRQLATISQDNSLRIWDLETLSQLYEVFSPGEIPTCVTYHPYKGSIIAGYSKGALRVIQDGEILEEYYTLSTPLTSVTILPNGEYLYVSDALGTLIMYAADKTELVEVKTVKHIVAKGGHRAPCAIKASRDSRLIAFVGPSEHCVSVLESRTLNCLIKLDVSSAVSSCLDSVQSVTFGTVVSRDLFVCTVSGKVLTVDTASGVIVTDRQPHQNSPVNLLVCDKYVVTASQQKFKISNYESNMSVSQKYVSYDLVNHMVFTPDLKQMVTCGDMVTVWSVGGTDIDTLMASSSGRKRVSFDEGEEKGRGSFGMKDIPIQSPVLEAPRPSSLEPVQSDVRLEHTLDTSDEKTLDLSAILLNPSQPPKEQPQPQIKSVREDNQPGSNDENSDLEKVSSLSDSDDDIPAPLAPLNKRHPFKLSPASLSPLSPEASAEPPLSLRHIVLDKVTSSLAPKRYMATEDTCGLELMTLIGNEYEARGNVVWRGTSMFYTLGNVIIVEDLKTSQQQHLIQHTETVTSLTSSHDKLASCSGAHKLNPSQICIWDIESLVLLRTLSYHEYQIQCLEFTIDGSYLISAGNYRENALVLWDLTNYGVHTVAKTERHVNAVSRDPQNNTEFVTVGSCVQFWILDHRQELTVATGSLPIQFMRSIGDEVEYSAVTYTDMGMVYVGTTSGHVTMWDPRSTTCVLHWAAHPQEIDVLCYNRDMLLTGGVSKNLKLWSIQNLESDESSVLLDDQLDFDSAIVSCAMDDRLQLGIVGTTSGSLWYVNWEEKTSIRLVGGHPDTVNDIATSPEGQFATACDDGSLRLWNFDPLEQTVQFQVLNAKCTCTVFKPGDSTKISAGYSDGTIRTFDLSSVALSCKMAPHHDDITRLQYAPSGQVLISGDMSSQVSVINSETGLIMRVISDHKTPNAGITALDFSTLTQHWLIGSADRRISVWKADWDVDDNKMVDWLSFPGPAYAPDGTALDKNHYSTLPPSLALFSPLEKHVILYTGYGINQELIFYNIKTRSTLRKFDLSHWATSLEVVLLSNLVVVGCNARLVTIMDYTSGTFQDYVAHPDAVRVVRYWEAKHALLTGSATSVALWNLKI